MKPIKSKYWGLNYTVGLDSCEDLVADPDLVDVVDVGVDEEEELVGQGQMLVLITFLPFHLCSSY